MTHVWRKMRTMAQRQNAVLPTTAVAALLSIGYLSLSSDDSLSSCEEESRRPKLIFLGTGSSTGCPKQLCTMLFQPNRVSKDPEILKLQAEHLFHCKTSNKAIIGDPKTNKDYRNNPSILISHYNNNSSQGMHAQNVIFDVGKTFREGAIRWMPVHGIRSLDAVILTHHHMDAVAGLDDLRGFQKVTGLVHAYLPRPYNVHGRPSHPVRQPIPIYLSQPCLEQVSRQFPWLFPTMKAANIVDHVTPVKRDVASLQVHVIQNYVPFVAAGLKVIPLPVLHGDDLISLGFAMSVVGSDKDKTPIHIVYISDISKMIPETLEFILTRLPQTDILILDALLPDHHVHPVHFNLPQAMELANQINPTQHTYVIGMSCDAFLPHDEMNASLVARGHSNISLAHDGLVVEL